MPKVQFTLEVERVVNLVKGFGWEKREEVIDGNKVRITFEKTLELPEAPETPV